LCTLAELLLTSVGFGARHVRRVQMGFRGG
jgi:hypothetical protein